VASDSIAGPARARDRDPGIPPVVPAVYFAVLFIGAWIALAHEVLVRLLGGPGLPHPLEELQILLVEVVLFVSPLVLQIVAHDASA